MLGGVPTTLYRATVESRLSSKGAVEECDRTMLYDTVGAAAAAGEALLELFKRIED